MSDQGMRAQDMSLQTMIAPGFSDPVFQSQAAFRALMAALAEPGTIQDLGEAIAPPPGFEPATATALLALADYETPIWIPASLREAEAGAWLRFHCAAPLPSDPAEAGFAVILAGAEAPPLARFAIGDELFPDRSATVILQCEALEGGAAVTLSGPGIAGTRRIAPRGLRAGFWTEVAANAALYPLGIDLLLACGRRIIGLPRSTQAEIEEPR